MDQNGDNPTFNVTLSLQGVNIADWNTTDGSQGLWVGLGYATTGMANADFTMCIYNYYGPENSRFNCGDGKMKTSQTEEPPYIWDDIQNIDNIVTLQQEFILENNTANFKVQFTRPFKTNDTMNDTNLDFIDTSFIWAHGYLNLSVPAYHGPTRGNEILDLSILKLDESPIEGSEDGNETEPEPSTPEPSPELTPLPPVSGAISSGDRLSYAATLLGVTSIYYMLY